MIYRTKGLASPTICLSANSSGALFRFAYPHWFGMPKPREATPGASRRVCIYIPGAKGIVHHVSLSCGLSPLAASPGSGVLVCPE
jgi:hypothetical protein